MKKYFEVPFRVDTPLMTRRDLRQKASRSFASAILFLVAAMVCVWMATLLGEDSEPLAGFLIVGAALGLLCVTLLTMSGCLRASSFFKPDSYRPLSGLALEEWESRNRRWPGLRLLHLALGGCFLVSGFIVMSITWDLLSFRWPSTGMIVFGLVEITLGSLNRLWDRK